MHTARITGPAIRGWAIGAVMGIALTIGIGFGLGWTSLSPTVEQPSASITRVPANPGPSMQFLSDPVK
jgi:hypothetical protein